ncbi:hypothetical protein Asphe3_09950 [Pseudarthrobacter phenanthrenivorans Sphe3]|uniref:Lipoprotein n=1 Tax=Pseudarthrobacter phenanthrenivorans (strain DSM 18606 / JCM 16027 / LMG 23796 / Sphe3) TaxID=930171 RepID=F0M3G5_PSEPM|nr:hypothetical protein [Pseudarthrobacter phenanthrenivorans]ADX72184.1 hypothetical protein Asphe3_09950 [Pseudarthrobacter phenanthrenivorans Sphe3]
MILDASFTFFYLGESLKKSIASLALVAVLALTACGGAGSTTSGAADTQTTQEAPKIPDLTGAWKQSNPNSETSYQQATITADKMTIEWVSDGGNTTSIYWVGTFAAPTSASEPYTWTSQRDVEATQSALLASSDATKEFKYEGGSISYKVSALGTTTTVNLKKN